MANETTVPPKPETRKMAATKAQQVLEQISKLETLKKEAIDELLAERQKIDEQLAQLGYNDGPPPKKKTGASKPAGERHCDICDMNGHDARAHRNQDPKKKFTAKELAEKGLA